MGVRERREMREYERRKRKKERHRKATFRLRLSVLESERL